MPVVLTPTERRQRIARIEHQLARVDRILYVDPKAALTVMRELTEQILACLLGDHTGKNHVGVCINVLDTELNKRKLLPKRVRVHVENLQRLGNLGAHHQEEEEEPTEEEARVAQGAVLALVKWYRQKHLGGGEARPAHQPAPAAMSQAQLDRARRYNRHGNFNPSLLSQLQALLGLPGHGQWDDHTIRGIHAFQVRDGTLAQDGMLGPATLGALLERLRQAGTEPHETYALTPERRAGALAWNLGQGLSRERVLHIQMEVGATTTGKLDEATTEAIFRWQLRHGLGPDALLGPATLDHLERAPKILALDCPPPSTPRVPAPTLTTGANTMQLSSRGSVELILDGLPPAQLERVQRATEEFRLCGNSTAATRGGYILGDLGKRKLTEDNLISLSKWCHSGSSYGKGVEPARELSHALFDGRIIPQLIDSRRKPLPRSQIRQRMQAFLTGKAETPPPAPDGSITKGSLHCLRRALDTMPEALAQGIIQRSPGLQAHGARDLDWLSPLPADGYQEYRDDFLQVLGLARHEPALRAFWPSMGPQWDGLARVKGAAPGVVLVEAKAHPDEMNSHCGAKDPESVRLITAALERAQRALGVQPDGPGPRTWMERHYQLANRLAFLRFMIEDLGVPTWLVLVLFLNDRSYKPTTLEAWQRHMGQVYAEMDLRQTPLLERVVLCPVEATR